MAIVKFVKGTVAKYNANESYKTNGSIFFATDQPIIFANGVAYKGLDQTLLEQVIDGVKDIEFSSTAKTLTIKYFKSGTQDKVIDLKEAMVEYTGEKAITVEGTADTGKKIALKIKDGEKVLSQDTNGLTSTLSLKYVTKTDTATAKLQLLGINDAVVHEIDATPFVKDGILSSAELKKGSELTGGSYTATNTYLVLTFNTDAAQDPIVLDVTELIDIYTAGNGIDITNKAVSIKLADSNDKYLSVTNTGLASKGIDDAISTAVATEKNRAEAAEEELEERIEDLEKAVGDDSVEDQIAEALGELALTEQGGTGKYIESVKQENGKVTATAKDLTATNVAATKVGEGTATNVQGILTELYDMWNWYEA